MSSTTINGYNIGAWNANGLRSKIPELINFILEEDIHIMCISETHFNASNRLVVPNFITYRKDRITGGGGGTAIIVKKNIPHDEVVFNSNSFENCTITVTDNVIGQFSISSIYKPPKLDISTNELATIINFLGKAILIGDFNSKSPNWLCSLHNKSGNDIADFISKNDYDILAPKNSTHLHSRFTANGSCIIDFAIAANIPLHKSISALHQLSSDHLPLILHISDNTLPSFCINNNIIDWDVYSNIIQDKFQNFTRPKDCHEIDTSIESLTKIISDSATAASVIPIKDHSFHKFPMHIKKLLNQRNRARRRFQRTGDPSFNVMFLDLKKRASKAIAIFKRDSWNNMLRNLTRGEPKYWRILRSFTRPREKDKPLLMNNQLTYSKVEKANIFACTYEDQCSDGPPPTSRDFINDFNADFVNLTSTNLINAEQDIIPVSPRLVHNTITKLKNRSSPGHDKITNRMLKHLPVKGFVALAVLFNACLQARYFPTTWKLAIIKPIPKPGKDLKYPANYRPISLLPVLGKLLERLIQHLIRTIEHKEGITLIPENQFGFQRKLSSVHQVLHLQEKILQGFNNKQHSAAVFLDMEKAFDKVWHQGLVLKISKLPLPNFIIMVLIDFLNCRKFMVSVGDHLSPPHPIQAGVAQGSVLGPFLFSVYINDLPSTPGTTTALFADDTALLSTSRSKFHAIDHSQDALDDLAEYFNDWRIQINPSKCVAVLFTHNNCAKKNRIPESNLLYDGRPIPWASEARYLGVLLDSRLSLRQHFETKRIKANKIYTALKPILGPRSKLAIRSRIHVYKSFIRPIMTYAAPVWAFLPPTVYLPIQVLQNIILRFICGAWWFHTNEVIHRDLHVESIEEFATRTSLKFFKKNKVHHNSTFSNAIDYDWAADQKYARPLRILDKDEMPP